MKLSSLKKILALIILALAVLDGKAQTPPSLDDYWHGEADWEYLGEFPLNSQNSSGPTFKPFISNQIKIVDGIWYMFHRTFDPALVPGGICQFPTGTQDQGGTGLEHQVVTSVARSLDQGETWSESVRIIPGGAGEWDCYATDGDAHYDIENNKWRFIFQCMTNGIDWRTCYLEKPGSDPMGLFQTVVPNPVLLGGELWSQICDMNSDDCSKSYPGQTRPVDDEGTFQIIKFDGLNYWVSFHGYDGVNGFRGVAKTPDFVNWSVGADAIFDPDDVNGQNGSPAWRESWDQGRSIGGGHSSTIKEGEYYYQFIEASDKNLACVPDQRWDVGVLRSKSLTNTKWAQLPRGNPIFYSSVGVGEGKCDLQYVQVFSDPMSSETYLKIGVFSFGLNTLIYKLKYSNNILDNGNLWKANTEGWTIFPIGPTEMEVIRNPARASDGNNFLSFDCGQLHCEDGQSIFQDIDATFVRGKSITFGGKFLSQILPGKLNIALLQLDENGAVISVDSTGARSVVPFFYQSLSRISTIAQNAKTLRYQIYLEGEFGLNKFSADEMFIALNESVDNRLVQSETLNLNEILYSSNGEHRLAMQGDGNLVIYNRANDAKWSSSSFSSSVNRLAMQSDGNLVIYTSSDQPVWHTSTHGNSGSNVSAVLKNSGVLVVETEAGEILWSSGESVGVLVFDN